MDFMFSLQTGLGLETFIV